MTVRRKGAAKKSAASKLKMERRARHDYKKAVARKRQAKNNYASSSSTSIVEEPLASYQSRIRPIGNSKGVILNNQVIEAAGLNPDADIEIKAGEGVIYIVEMKANEVNTDLSTWDTQYKAANKKGAKPEGDLFEGMKNEFDFKEW